MEIWIHRNGQFAGRFSESAIRDKIADGSFSPTDLAWDEAKPSWKPISEFLASVPAATSTSPSNAPAAEAEPPSHAADPPSLGFGVASRAAATEELKPAESPRLTPPPLPSMTMPAAGPPPLPLIVSGTPGAMPAAQPSSSQPPEGETIWSPTVAILGSIFLSPAFGGFIVWRNWLTM